MADDMSLIRDEPKTEDDWTLGSCGCIDYHYSDCPTRGGINAYGDASDYDEEEGR